MVTIMHGDQREFSQAGRLAKCFGKPLLMSGQVNPCFFVAYGVVGDHSAVWDWVHLNGESCMGAFKL